MKGKLLNIDLYIWLNNVNVQSVTTRQLQNVTLQDIRHLYGVWITGNLEAQLVSHQKSVQMDQTFPCPECEYHATQWVIFLQ